MSNSILTVSEKFVNQSCALLEKGELWSVWPNEISSDQIKALLESGRRRLWLFNAEHPEHGFASCEMHGKILLVDGFCLQSLEPTRETILEMLVGISKSAAGKGAERIWMPQVNAEAWENLQSGVAGVMGAEGLILPVGALQLAAAQASFPLTGLQQGMLYHWLDSPGHGRDIEQMVCRFSARPDLSQLRVAWEKAVRHFEALRCVFDWTDDVPAQRILSEVPLQWHELDFSNADDAAAAFEDFLHQDRMQGFCLSDAPLFRITYIKMPREETILVWTVHHMLLDGRSMVTVLRGVFSGEFKEHPALGNYLSWRAARENAGSEAFWKEHLQGASAVPVVIGGIGNRTAQATQNERDHFLTSEETAEISDFATRHGLTVNTLVTGAWMLVLSRYSGEMSIVTGTTRACRHGEFTDAENLVGLLVNTVPLRMDLADAEAPVQYLQRLRSLWLEMRDHELTPLPQIRRWAGKSGTEALFNHLVVFENGDFNSALAGIGHQFDLKELTTVPLTLQAYGGQRLRLHCAFDAADFDPVLIEGLLRHVASALNQLTQADAIGEIVLPGLDERQMLLSLGRPVPVEHRPPVCLHQWFEKQVAKHPDAIALHQSGKTLTYAELNRQANQLAHLLIGEGVRAGQLVGLCLDRNLHLIISLLGILKSGAAYLPIDLSYPPERLAFMLEDAEAAILLTQTDLLAKLPAHKGKNIAMDAVGLLDGCPSNNPGAEVLPEDPAYVIFTSGSTGRPKGCVVTHANVCRLMTSTEHWFGFNASDVWTMFHSPAFDFSVWEIWGALLYGGRLEVVPFMTSRSPEDFYQLLVREGVTVLNQTPSAFRQLMAAEESLLGNAASTLRLRYVIFGGEALEMQSLVPWFERHGDQKPRLVNMYGITETTVHVTYRPLGAADVKKGSVIGVPIPDLEICILDNPMNPVPVGIPGEMFVGGAGLARGYLNRPELTAERFLMHSHDGAEPRRLYRTGDLARFLPDGDVEYLGRIDQQVKIRGFRIELGEIESVLNAHPDIRESAVLAVEQHGSKRLIAWIVCRGSGPNAEALRVHLREKMPDYMVPSDFVAVERMPVTTNGKLDRKALPMPVRSADSEGAQVPASTTVEVALAEVWKKVLRLPNVGVQEDFFDLGGDSILSIHMISQARKAGIRISPAQVFANPTIAGLAKVVDGAAEQNFRDSAGESGSVRDLPLLPIHHWFFRQKLAQPHHYNQAYLLSVKEQLNPEMLAQALAALVAQHAALRLRFSAGESGEMQQDLVAPAEAPIRLEIHAWQDVPADRVIGQLSSLTGEAQRSVHYSTGPLLRVDYMDLGAGRPGRLLLVAHHFAVDAVSWGVLLEDLEVALRQVGRGEPIALTIPPTSYAAALHEAKRWGTSPNAKQEISFWRDAVIHLGDPVMIRPEHQTGPNTEASVEIAAFQLSREETQDLLKRVPQIFRSRINEVLLSALLLTMNRVDHRWSITLHLEGHGREAIFGELDLSRTVGWFTSIHPICLQLPQEMGIPAVLRAVKEKLRATPQHGAGYGVLRQIPSALPDLGEQPDFLFNYLGQMDELTRHSEIFEMTAESTGPWHSMLSMRAYRHEIECCVQDGKFQLDWRFSRNSFNKRTIQSIVESLADLLREIIAYSKESRTISFSPSDFALVSLDQSQIDKLAAKCETLEDIFPLSPTQELFLSMAQSRPGSGLDLWRGKITGPLEVETFRAAWQTVVNRHPLLRGSIHQQHVSQPVVVVSAAVELPWQEQDYSSLAAEQAEQAWQELLRAQLMSARNLEKPSLTRFIMARFGGDEFRFCWLVPDLLLDGWSWPVVFGEVSRVYQSLVQGQASEELPKAPSYARYLKWLKAQDPSQAMDFWKTELAEMIRPTTVPGLRNVNSLRLSRFGRYAAVLPDRFASLLSAASKKYHIGQAAIVQAAWAVLLSRGANTDDVVLGVALNGRPTEIDGVESIVGPFTGNLPLRCHLAPEKVVAMLWQDVQQKLNRIQSIPQASLMQIQESTKVPWKYRLFDSLVVFQNYLVDEDALKIGDGIVVHGLDGPLHTNYPLMLVVSPGEQWRLTIILPDSTSAAVTADKVLRELQRILTCMVEFPEMTVGDLLQDSLLPADIAQHEEEPQRVRIRKAPETIMEERICSVWKRAFGLDSVGTDENFFDLGGHSLLMVRVHQQLCRDLERGVPLVQLFHYPTVASLAAFLDPKSPPLHEPTAPAQQFGPLRSVPTEKTSVAIAARQRALAARGALRKF
jgi:amino acid adenylation domain-containing protein/non-ribosomal peptide synthase protein (TIGR01720 family)